MTIFNSFKTACLILSVSILQASNASLREYKWILENDISAPESVYYEPETGFIFVSNIFGEGNVKDGKGWIQKISPNGNVIKSKWVSGLNAPKGMRAQNGVLWVTDIDTLVAIDIATASILKKIAKPESKFLNDIAISESGDVYVSDTIGRKIYRLNDGNSSLEVFFEGDETESPNGLLIQGDKLIVAAWGLAAEDWSTISPGRLYSIDLKTKAKALITTQPLGNLDGLEIRKNGNYLVSDWSNGQIYEITKDGKSASILNTGEKGTADIGYIMSSDTLIVPGMLSNKITAYDLSQHARSQDLPQDKLPQLNSIYNLSEEIVTHMGWREETTTLSTSEGKRRFEELRQNGWQCQVKLGNGVCRLNIAKPLLPEENLELLKQFDRYKQIEIGLASSLPELVLDAPTYREYRLSQTLTWGPRQWMHLNLYLNPEIMKLNLPNAKGQTEESFIVLSEEKLERQTRFKRIINRWITETVVVGLQWVKNTGF